MQDDEDNGNGTAMPDLSSRAALGQAAFQYLMAGQPVPEAVVCDLIAVAINTLGSGNGSRSFRPLMSRLHS